MSNTVTLLANQRAARLPQTALRRVRHRLCSVYADVRNRTSCYVRAGSLKAGKLASGVALTHHCDWNVTPRLDGAVTLLCDIEARPTTQINMKVYLYFV